MIAIDDVGYVKKQDVQEESNYKILVLVHGHVIRGNVEKTQDGYVVRNGEVIRKWGTTQGLGELAKKGNKATPTIDPLNGLVFVEKTAVIYTIDVEV